MSAAGGRKAPRHEVAGSWAPVVQRRYGDLMLAPNSGMDVMPAECGWRICILRPEAGDGRLGERWERVSELREHRAR